MMAKKHTFSCQCRTCKAKRSAGRTAAAKKRHAAKARGGRAAIQPVSVHEAAEHFSEHPEHAPPRSFREHMTRHGAPPRGVPQYEHTFRPRTLAHVISSSLNRHSGSCLDNDVEWQAIFDDLYASVFKFMHP